MVAWAKENVASSGLSDKPIGIPVIIPINTHILSISLSALNKTIYS